MFVQQEEEESLVQFQLKNQMNQTKNRLCFSTKHVTSYPQAPAGIRRINHIPGSSSTPKTWVL